jgi:hypothetical protein
MRKLTFKRMVYGAKIKFTIKWNPWAKDEDFDILKDQFSNLIENVKNNKEHEFIRKGYQPDPYKLGFVPLNPKNLKQKESTNR